MISPLYTQVHCLRAGQVLLMRRRKEPNLGLWVAPGGKIETHESPYESAARELYEETGLVVREMHLRGLVSTVAPARAYSSIHFLYAVTGFTGQLAADGREGTRLESLDHYLCGRRAAHSRCRIGRAGPPKRQLAGPAVILLPKRVHSILLPWLAPGVTRCKTASA
jgi:ADP-ribose pyrophosphatase YjhB (NUDIX family)